MLERSLCSTQNAGVPVQIARVNGTVQLIDDNTSTDPAVIVGTNVTACGGSFVHLLRGVLVPCCNVTTNACTSAPFLPGQRLAANNAFDYVFNDAPPPNVRPSYSSNRWCTRSNCVPLCCMTRQSGWCECGLCLCVKARSPLVGTSRGLHCCTCGVIPAEKLVLGTYHGKWNGPDHYCVHS
jgi:hypothetical protein